MGSTPVSGVGGSVSLSRTSAEQRLFRRDAETHARDGRAPRNVRLGVKALFILTTIDAGAFRKTLCQIELLILVGLTTAASFYRPLISIYSRNWRFSVSAF